VLLDPTDCFSGLNFGYKLRAVPLFVRPSAERARQVLEWESTQSALDPLSLELACLGGGEFRGAKIVMPKPPAAKLLTEMTVPTLVLLAEHSKAHNIRLVRASAERLLPRLTVAVLRGGSHHSIPASEPDQLNRELVEFLACWLHDAPAPPAGGMYTPRPAPSALPRRPARVPGQQLGRPTAGGSEHMRPPQTALRPSRGRVQSARQRAAESTRGWCSRHWPGSGRAANTGRHDRHGPAEGFRDMRRARTDKEQIWQSQARQSW
jgi:hypothetical protein